MVLNMSGQTNGNGKKREILLFASNYISSKLSISAGDTVIRRSTVSSNSLFSALVENYSISENDFIQILIDLKSIFPMTYNKIKISKKLINKSLNSSPELCPDNNKINCLIQKDIYAKEFYEEVDDNKKWNAGIFVWLPKNHPKLKTYIENKYIRIVNS